MIRRLLIVGAVVAAVAPVPASADALVSVKRLSAQGNHQEWLVAATGRRLDPNEVEVYENGHPLSGVKVRYSREGVSIAVLIDSSSSMRGKPLAAALAAAAEVVRNPESHVRTAVYVFNNETTKLADFGLVGSAAEARLAFVTTSGGTHLYDAVADVTRDLAKVATPSKVLLVISDGGDRNSTTTLDAAASAAGLAGVKVFTVGLASRNFDSASLKDLAARTGGTYSEAPDVETLGRLQTSIANSITNQLVVSFDSNLTAPGATASTSIVARGFTDARISYALPTVPVIAEAPGFWQSRNALLALVGVAALLVFALSLLLLRPRKATVAQRVAEYHMTARAREARESVFLDDLLDRTEKRLKDVAWARRLEIELDRANIAMRASQLVLFTGAAAGVLGLGFALLFRHPAGVAFGAIAPTITWLVIRAKAGKRQREFNDQLPDNLAVLSQSLRAGFSLLQALDSVADNAAEPSKSEFRRVLTQTRLGGSVEAAMDELGIRMQSKDFGWVVAVVSIQSKVGGNMAEILDSVAETVLERQRLRRHVRALTAQGRMTQSVLTALPFGVGALIYLMNPDLMNEMLNRTVGVIVLAMAAGMTVLGGLVISRIVKIEI